MEKLPMCRICLVEDVNMYVVVNKNLHELYEKLTDIPFVTKDSRPILACFFCCAKLKQCFRFLRKCLEAEELFVQMMNGDYEPNPSVSQDNLQCCTGFIKSPTVHVNIVDEFETDSIAIKEEVPAICERQDDVIEPNEEYQSDDVVLELENLNNTCLGTEDIPPHLSESDSGGDVNIEVEEEQELTKKKRRAVETNSVPAAKKLKLDVQRDKNEDLISPNHMKKGQEQTKNTENIKRSTAKTIAKTTKKITNIQTSPKNTNNTTCIKEKNNIQTTNSKEITASSQCNNVNKDDLKCKKCSYSGINSSDIKRHSLRHNSLKCDKHRPYECDICQSSFIKSSHLLNHIRTHTGEKPYKCDVCQRSFTRKDNLETHIRKHTGEKHHKCEVCQSSFNDQSNLKRHIRTHTGEQPYKCDFCQKSFGYKNVLENHIRTHTGEKPHKCDVCQRSFTRKDRLETHIRTHTGEKPYKCDFCQKSFGYKNVLENHNRTHTGEKPHKCDRCPISYSDKRSLKYHVLKHHT